MSLTTPIRTEREVDQLRNLALRMGGLAEDILEKSLRALWARDAEMARSVAADDLAIDRIDVEIDAAVLNVLALRAPVAVDLRLTLAIKTMATDLERIGDLARNVAGCAERLADRPPLPWPDLLKRLASQSTRSLSRAMQSFADLDVSLARAVLDEDDEIDECENQFIQEAIEKIQAEPSTSAQAVDFIFVAKSLERVADHATNIAEEVVLAAESINLKHSEKLQR